MPRRSAWRVSRWHNHNLHAFIFISPQLSGGWFYLLLKCHSFLFFSFLISQFLNKCVLHSMKKIVSQKLSFFFTLPKKGKQAQEKKGLSTAIFILTALFGKAGELIPSRFLLYASLFWVSQCDWLINRQPLVIFLSFLLHFVGYWSRVSLP